MKDCHGSVRRGNNPIPLIIRMVESSLTCASGWYADNSNQELNAPLRPTSARESFVVRLSHDRIASGRRFRIRI